MPLVPERSRHHRTLSSQHVKHPVGQWVKERDCTLGERHLDGLYVPPSRAIWPSGIKRARSPKKHGCSKAEYRAIQRHHEPEDHVIRAGHAVERFGLEHGELFLVAGRLSDDQRLKLVESAVDVIKATVDSVVPPIDQLTNGEQVALAGWSVGIGWEVSLQLVADRWNGFVHDGPFV